MYFNKKEVGGRERAWMFVKICVIKIKFEKLELKIERVKVWVK
jgi:hypothetical protein